MHLKARRNNINNINNTVVVYKSKYGTTKQYAEWISEELFCDIFDITKSNVSNIKKYDTIIFGGGLYAGGILGFDFLKKHFEAIKTKKLILFTVGLADPENKNQFNDIINSSLNEDMKEHIKVFHLRGGINYKKINFVHKAMMVLLKKSVEKKKQSEITDETREMLETYGKEVDFTDKETIFPIINFVKS